MPIDYSGTGTTQKEAFSQSTAALLLQITDMGAGVCQICSMWWLEHLKAGGTADDSSYIFNDTAVTYKNAFIQDRNSGNSWDKILSKALVDRGFKGGLIGGKKDMVDLEGKGIDESMTSVLNILKASSPNYHIVILGPVGGIDHVCAMHNDNGTYHLFDPNAGHYKTTSDSNAKKWLVKARDYYYGVSDALDHWTVVSFST